VVQDTGVWARCVPLYASLDPLSSMRQDANPRPGKLRFGIDMPAQRSAVDIEAEIKAMQVRIRKLVGPDAGTPLALAKALIQAFRDDASHMLGILDKLAAWDVPVAIENRLKQVSTEHGARHRDVVMIFVLLLAKELPEFALEVRKIIPMFRALSVQAPPGVMPAVAAAMTESEVRQWIEGTLVNAVKAR
jgi:hypothetical protein